MLGFPSPEKPPEIIEMDKKVQIESLKVRGFARAGYNPNKKKNSNGRK